MNVENKISVIFAGDFAPCRRYESIVIKKGETIFGDALPIIQSADISFVNLECPLTTHDKAIIKSGPALKANPKCISALKSFSVIGLANNHILDFGEQGLQDTISVCNDNGLATVGAGLTLREAQNFFIQEVKGLKVAIIAIAEYEFNQSEGGAGSAPIDPIDNYRQIKEAKIVADIVLITIHGGNEYFPYPRPGLRKLCQHYVDIGVDAVICHHPHVSGAYEVYNGSPIIYSLGNLVFDHPTPPKGWDEGYLVKLLINTTTKGLDDVELIPYHQSVSFAGIRLLNDKVKIDFLDKIEGYRDDLNNNDAWLMKWEQFLLAKRNSVIVGNYFPFSFKGLGFITRHMPLIKLIFPKSSILRRLNLIRCQSHRELLIDTIKHEEWVTLRKERNKTKL